MVKGDRISDGNYRYNDFKATATNCSEMERNFKNAEIMKTRYPGNMSQIHNISASNQYVKPIPYELSFQQQGQLAPKPELVEPFKTLPVNFVGSSASISLLPNSNCDKVRKFHQTGERINVDNYSTKAEQFHHPQTELTALQKQLLKLMIEQNLPCKQNFGDSLVNQSQQICAMTTIEKMLDKPYVHYELPLNYSGIPLQQQLQPSTTNTSACRSSEIQTILLQQQSLLNSFPQAALNIQTNSISIPDSHGELIPEVLRQRCDSGDTRCSRTSSRQSSCWDLNSPYQSRNGSFSSGTCSVSSNDVGFDWAHEISQGRAFGGGNHIQEEIADGKLSDYQLREGRNNLRHLSSELKSEKLSLKNCEIADYQAAKEKESKNILERQFEHLNQYISCEKSVHDTMMQNKEIELLRQDNDDAGDKQNSEVHQDATDEEEQEPSRVEEGAKKRRRRRRRKRRSSKNIGQSSKASEVNKALFKTELCRTFEELGACRYGDRCQYAHGTSELHSVVRNARYKTVPCRTFHTLGFCPYGQRCHFIHNSNQTSDSADELGDFSTDKVQNYSQPKDIEGQQVQHARQIQQKEQLLQLQQQQQQQQQQRTLKIQQSQLEKQLESQKASNIVNLPQHYKPIVDDTEKCCLKQQPPQLHVGLQQNQSQTLQRDLLCQIQQHPLQATMQQSGVQQNRNLKQPDLSKGLLDLLAVQSLRNSFLQKAEPFMKWSKEQMGNTNTQYKRPVGYCMPHLTSPSMESNLSQYGGQYNRIGFIDQHDLLFTVTDNMATQWLPEAVKNSTRNRCFSVDSSSYSLTDDSDHA